MRPGTEMKVIVDVSVATIDAEIAHQGTWRPPRKYCAVVFCLRAKKAPAATTPARYPKTIAMSRRRNRAKRYQYPGVDQPFGSSVLDSRPSAVRPEIPPSPIVSTALEGTITIDPFSL